MDLNDELDNLTSNHNLSFSLLDNNYIHDDVYNKGIEKKRIASSRSLEKFSSASFDYELFNKTSLKHVKQDYIAFHYGKNMKIFLIEGLRSKNNGSLYVEKINKSIDNTNFNILALLNFIKVKGESGYSLFLLDEFHFIRKFYFKNVIFIYNITITN